MVGLPELEPLSRSLAVWRAYDPGVKAELSSAALCVGGQVYLVDPIRLTPRALDGWATGASVDGIFVTNVNHARATGSFAAETDTTIRASAETANQLSDLEIVPLRARERIAERIEVIAIVGAAEGEIAIHFDDQTGGAIILGDALIHFGSDGFALLPEKYCTDQQQLRRSLRQLLDFRFERLLFAHGPPLLANARARLEEILRQ